MNLDRVLDAVTARSNEVPQSGKGIPQNDLTAGVDGIGRKNDSDNDAFRKRYEEVIRSNVDAQESSKSAEDRQTRRTNDSPQTEKCEIQNRDSDEYRNRAVNKTDSKDTNDTNKVNNADQAAQATPEPQPAAPKDGNNTAAIAKDGPVNSTAATIDVKKTGTTDKTETDQDKKTAEAVEASDVLTEALAVITQLLNVKVSSEDIYHLNLTQPSEAGKKELAEILSAVKGIAGVIDESVKNNAPLEINGVKLDVSQLASLGKQIRQEVFRIEYALQILGVAQDVNNQVAQMQQKFVSPNIPQATDLDAKQMPAVHLNQIMADQGDAQNPGETDVNVLLQQLAATLRKDPVTQKTDTNGTAIKDSLFEKISALKNVKEGTDGVTTDGIKTDSVTTDGVKTDVVKTDVVTADGVKIEGVKTDSVTTDDAALRQISAIDPKVKRMLLKIDGVQSTVAENQKAAAGNEKLDLPKNLNLSFGKSLAAETASATIQMTLDKSSEMGPQADPTQALGSRLTDVINKLDESVQTQLLDKFTAMMKTGADEIRLVLKPESLGEVHIKVRMDGDIVITRMHVENQVVKQIIENNLPSLKNALEQQNLQAGSFSVDVGDGRQDLSDGQKTSGSSNQPVSGGLAFEGAAGASQSGLETGRRFGSNTIEYFA